MLWCCEESSSQEVSGVQGCSATPGRPVPRRKDTLGAGVSENNENVLICLNPWLRRPGMTSRYVREKSCGCPHCQSAAGKTPRTHFLCRRTLPTKGTSSVPKSRGSTGLRGALSRPTFIQFVVLMRKLRPQPGSCCHLVSGQSADPESLASQWDSQVRDSGFSLTDRQDCVCPGHLFSDVA